MRTVCLISIVAGVVVSNLHDDTHLNYQSLHRGNDVGYVLSIFFVSVTRCILSADKVMKMKSFTEQKASEYIGTLLSAISYIHKFSSIKSIPLSP